MRRLEKTSAPPAKTTLRIATAWHNWQHRTSRALANAAGTSVAEDLQAARMTGREKGTAVEPGWDVSVKAGWNREILATAWENLRRI